MKEEERKMVEREMANPTMMHINKSLLRESDIKIINKLNLDSLGTNKDSKVMQSYL